MGLCTEMYLDLITFNGAIKICKQNLYRNNETPIQWQSSYNFIEKTNKQKQNND